MKGFVQDHALGISTLSEISRVHGDISPDAFFGCYAYATQSGFRIFELNMGDDFWINTPSRWLFGIDYGRSDPRALREVASRKNSEVRVYDGRFVVKSPGFVPRRDFHPKVAMMENTLSGAQAMVLGSGNFSYNGLRRSVEAGITVTDFTKSSTGKYIKTVKSGFELLWSSSCLLGDIIVDYENSLANLVAAKDAQRSTLGSGSAKGFWIEAGYVTKNRGAGKPGNQIFAPAGFRKYFGFSGTKGGTTLIGEIAFETSVGPSVRKNYRENDNGMEKLTLPMPEDHGFGVYDGKVLMFERRGSRFLLSAIEHGEFERVYGHRLVNIDTMGGGRRYGEYV
ncbi:hypothetical protein [Gemmobacter sp.]|uniref:hypothetical protein n=1 Tax=Gemmobacter sp. TaxID=1898957 RepID=UPI002AFDD0DE|nr:hypothetical protein [Gemmobacter sp.]